MTTRKVNGATVRALREALGIRHGALAREIEISAGYLTRIEQGLQQPAAPVVRKIADRFGVPIDAITYPAPAVAPIPEAVPA